MPLILVFEFVAGGVVASAVVASAVAVGAVVPAPVAPELFFASGLALFFAAAVAFVVALALAEGDDQADALDVAPGPVTGPPAIFIALVVPN